MEDNTLTSQPNSTIETIKKACSELKDIPQGWDIETIFRGFLSLAPCGGLIEKLLFANKDKKEIKKIIAFLYILGSQLQKIGSEKLDKEFLKSDEFYILLKTSLEKIKYQLREEKIHLFKNFLIKCSLKKEYADNHELEKTYLLNKLENIDILHFQILEWYFNNNFLNTQEIGAHYTKQKIEELSKLTKYYKEYENDLVALGFLEDVSSGRIGGGHFSIPSTLGKVFFNFIQYDDV